VVEAAGLTRSEHGSITGEVAALMSALPVATGEPPEGAGTQS
jgi:hypothetical protein